MTSASWWRRKSMSSAALQAREPRCTSEMNIARTRRVASVVSTIQGPPAVDSPLYGLPIRESYLIHVTVSLPGPTQRRPASQAPIPRERRHSVACHGDKWALARIGGAWSCRIDAKRAFEEVIDCRAV